MNKIIKGVQEEFDTKVMSEHWETEGKRTILKAKNEAGKGIGYGGRV